MLVDEFVSFCGRSGKIIKELSFLADDARDSTTTDVLRGGEKAHRRAAPVDKFRTSAGEEFVVLGFLESVANDDSVDDARHGPLARLFL